MLNMKMKLIVSQYDILNKEKRYNYNNILNSKRIKYYLGEKRNMIKNNA